MKKNTITDNPWTPEDEREHPLSVIEWWYIEAFFKSIEDNKRWSIKSGFNEWLYPKSKEIGCIFNMTLFEQDKNKHLIYYSRNDSTKLKSDKDNYYVRYEDSFMKGSYPCYEFYFNDKKNNIKLDMRYQAEVLPHWLMQDVTDGKLPMGMGLYRYGFIPKCKISGTMIRNNTTYHIDGKGYFEHVWGDFWYDNPLSNFSGLKKTIPTYSKLIGWWLHNNKIRIPKSIMFATENNPLGYDWAWALLDNGWTIFYGNIMFWIMEGPAPGVLILLKDGNKYEEFGNIYFKYNKTRHSKEYDFYYPEEMEVTAQRRKEKLHLRFTMTTDSREHIVRFLGGKHWLGYVICEAPGTVDGTYFDGEKKIKLSGICKIEPQRQASVIGHNSLKIDILKPPSGVGISFDLDSHFFRKKIFTQIQLVPHPKIKFNLKKINNSNIDKKIK